MQSVLPQPERKIEAIGSTQVSEIAVTGRLMLRHPFTQLLAY